MKDSVRVHKALVDSLGVKKLIAVAGASGGSIQAMEWGAEYPELVERVIHVIGPGLDIHPYVIGLLDLWMMPIKLDPNWKGGDYYGGAEPNEGLAQSAEDGDPHRAAFRLGREDVRLQVGRRGEEPGDAMGNLFAIEDALYKTGAARAKSTDAHLDDLHGEGEPALPAHRRRDQGHEGEDPVRAGGRPT